jgi:hypothetical protein
MESDIYLSPGDSHDKTFYIQARLFGLALRAHLEVTRGNLRLLEGYAGIKSGLATPAAVAGLALIHVDAEYKGVRVVLPDGTVKTLVSDDHPTANYCEIITY